MLEHERHLRRACELRPRLVIDRHASRPHLDRHAAFDMLVIEIRRGHLDLLDLLTMVCSRGDQLLMRLCLMLYR
jgi:hypothetical protein